MGPSLDEQLAVLRRQFASLQDEVRAVTRNPLFGIQPGSKVKPLSVATGSLQDGAVTNAKVNAAAAIAYSKLNLTNSIVLGDLVAAARRQFLRGYSSSTPNITSANTGHAFPVGNNGALATTTNTRRLYIDEGTWTLGTIGFRLLLESLGVGDTFAVGVKKNEASLGTVTYNDGDAVGLQKTIDLSATTVTVDDYLTVTYTQSNAAAQDNRVTWGLPMHRTA